MMILPLSVLLNNHMLKIRKREQLTAQACSRIDCFSGITFTDISSITCSIGHTLVSITSTGLSVDYYCNTKCSVWIAGLMTM